MKFSQVKLLFLILFVIFSYSVNASIYPYRNNPLRTNPLPGNCTTITMPDWWPKTWPDAIDCRDVTWTQAFDAMHAKISHEYAYSKWRGIDWDSLYNQFRPRIVAAEIYQNKIAYYQAIREYLLSLHDGHIWINPNWNDSVATQFVADAVYKHIGGSYGLIITQTDDGKFIVSYVLPKSSAENADIKPGDEVIAWNGLPIKQAIEKTVITWSDEFEDWGFTDFDNHHSYSSYNPATLSGLAYEKIRLLVHAPIGHKAQITFISSTNNQIKKATLIALDDQKKILNLTRLYPIFSPDKMPPLAEYKILPSGYGYLKIIEEDANPSDSKVYVIVKNAIELFIKNKVPGVVLDLRGNVGGADQLSADLAGFFTDKIKFYESLMTYNKQIGRYEFFETINITPQPFHYDGPVMVLTNVGTISSGEGIPMIAKKLPNLHIASFDSNTHGAFGMPWFYMIYLPGNFFVSYPIGRSVDENNRIQVDADKDLIGGVKSDIKIPMDAATSIDIYTHGKDKPLEFAENCLRNQCWIYKK